MTRRRPPRPDEDTPPRDARHDLGDDGEARACAHYRALGFRIVGRRVRTRVGEIDVLARRRRLWVAIEVKTRRGHPAPERTVTDGQRQRIRAALTALAPQLRPRPRTLRIDIAAVAWTAGAWEVRVFPGITWDAPAAPK